MNDKLDLKKTITDHFVDIFREQKIDFKDEITDDMVLLETGLDSLGFAILVVKLNEKLGYDPFQLMESPFYPKTFIDFLECYEKFKPFS